MTVVTLVRVIVTLTFLLPSVASAHEIGTTTVRLTLHNNQTWSADITTAPQALANKLEAEAGVPRSADLNAEALRARLLQLRDPLARHIDVRFDGSVSSAGIAVAQLEVPSDITQPAFVVLRATGTAPERPQAVTWRYGLAYSTYAVAFTAEGASSPVTQWLDGDAASRPFPVANTTPPSRLEIVWQYLRLGFVHIVPEGVDHILFVLGIFLLNTRLKPILIQVTAFTVAHSITLGLTMYDVISLPSRIVEPLIALSIVYVAIENIATTRLTPWRPVVVFAFGLLHGMGFAGILRGLDVPRSEIIPALISFNIGIELGQLAVIAAAFLAVALWRNRSWYRGRVVIPASVLIAATGIFWTVQRVAEF